VELICQNCRRQKSLKLRVGHTQPFFEGRLVINFAPLGLATKSGIQEVGNSICKDSLKIDFFLLGLINGLNSNSIQIQWVS